MRRGQAGRRRRSYSKRKGRTYKRKSYPGKAHKKFRQKIAGDRF